MGRESGGTEVVKVERSPISAFNVDCALRFAGGSSFWSGEDEMETGVGWRVICRSCTGEAKIFSGNSVGAVVTEVDLCFFFVGSLGFLTLSLHFSLPFADGSEEASEVVGAEVSWVDFVDKGCCIERCWCCAEADANVEVAVIGAKLSCCAEDDVSAKAEE